MYLKEIKISGFKSFADKININLDDDNNYNGWVTDFNLRNNDNKSAIKLDLHKEKDLFLLFRCNLNN